MLKQISLIGTLSMSAVFGLVFLFKNISTEYLEKILAAAQPIEHKFLAIVSSDAIKKAQREKSVIFDTFSGQKKYVCLNKELVKSATYKNDSDCIITKINKKKGDIYQASEIHKSALGIKLISNLNADKLAYSDNLYAVKITQSLGEAIKQQDKNNRTISVKHFQNTNSEQLFAKFNVLLLLNINIHNNKLLLAEEPKDFYITVRYLNNNHMTNIQNNKKHDDPIGVISFLIDNPENPFIFKGHLYRISDGDNVSIKSNSSRPAPKNISFMQRKSLIKNTSFLKTQDLYLIKPISKSTTFKQQYENYKSKNKICWMADQNNQHIYKHITNYVQCDGRRLSLISLSVISDNKKSLIYLT